MTKTEIIPIKVPPHNLDAEQYALAGCFNNPQIIPKVQELIETDDFYREAHIFIAEALFGLKKDVDLISVSDYLTKKGLLEKCGGQDYIASLVEACSLSVGYAYWCGIIKDTSNRRKVIASCQARAVDAFNLNTETTQILADLKSDIKGIELNETADFRQNTELVKEVFKDIEDRAQSGNRFVGIKTGFENIDCHLYGLEPKTTSYLIARPSMGKTALALNIADYVALNYPGKVPFFSLESGDKALTRRRLSRHSKVYLSRLRTGDIEDSQWPDLIEAADILSENNLIIIDSPRYKVVENLTVIAESLAMKSPISLIVIDHIQRMRSKKKFNNRHLELSYISEEISSIANDLDIPIIILCQLSRDVERRQKKRQNPQLSDMKESGDLEANADSVWGLWREDKEAEIAQIEGLKGRDTGTWRTWLRFDRFIQKFSDCEEMMPGWDEENNKGYNGEG